MRNRRGCPFPCPTDSQHRFYRCGSTCRLKDLVSKSPEHDEYVDINGVRYEYTNTHYHDKSESYSSLPREHGKAGHMDPCFEDDVAGHGCTEQHGYHNPVIFLKI